MNRKLTTAEFIVKAKDIHGNQYDYSKTEYINYKTKVCIICPIHGEFWQTPSNHLQGNKCIYCSGQNPLTTESFIERAKKIHGDKYDYSKVIYKRYHEKVCIICKQHGEFWQTPHDHLKNKGCPFCVNHIRLGVNGFIERAKKIHGNKYDYSKVEYINNRTKVCIICPIHGEFLQTPTDHLRGRSCPKCSLSHLENEIDFLLKMNNIEYTYEKQFNWLGKLSLDFYLPQYNIAIECQGIQHFKPIKHFGGNDNFNIIIERDKRKYKLCEENGIKILYYSDLNIDYPYIVYTNKELLIKEITEKKEN